MKTFPKSFLLAALLAISVQGAALAAADPAKWQKQMAEFEEQDRANPPVQNGVLFLGSSSIRLWKTLAEDFPGVPVLNRGFGGSQIPDSIHYFDTLVTPSKPRMIVFFAGVNDISAGDTAEEVAANFREFCAKVHNVLPETRVLFISVPFVESRWKERAEIALANTYVSAFCHSDPRLTYVDMNSVILTPEGKVRPEYYRDDKLHMNADGYAVWTNMLRPLIKIPAASSGVLEGQPPGLTLIRTGSGQEPDPPMNSAASSGVLNPKGIK